MNVACGTCERPCGSTLALFNKEVFGRRHGGFPAPLFLTSVQFCIQYFIADLTLRFLAPSLKPKRAIPWGVYLTQVAPVGVAMGLDIGLSNLSLVYVTVSFYTLAKAGFGSPPCDVSIEII